MATSRPTGFTLTGPGRLRLYSTAELLRLPPPEWLIENIMPVGGLVGLYGQPGTGKSFVAMDMALSVSTGQAWQEHTTKRGFCLYVAAEGGAGIGKRALAWLEHKRIHARDANVAWLTESIPVTNDSEEIELLFKRILNEIRDTPSLVVIDTLARCFDGDENQQLDMGRFIKGVDKMRTEFEATVIVVHHTRLDGERERGNTAFRGAADVMIQLKRDAGAGIALKCSKQKDSEEFHDIHLQLRVVPNTNSCVVMAQALSARTAIIDTILARHSVGFTELMSAVREKIGVSTSTVKRELVSLRENGEIIKENSVYRLGRVQDEDHDPTT